MLVTVIALGHLLLGHVEEGTSTWRKAEKLFGPIGVEVLNSATLGRVWFFASLGLVSLVVLDVHT